MIALTLAAALAFPRLDPAVSCAMIAPTIQGERLCIGQERRYAIVAERIWPAVPRQVRATCTAAAMSGPRPYGRLIVCLDRFLPVIERENRR